MVIVVSYKDWALPILFAGFVAIGVDMILTWEDVGSRLAGIGVVAVGVLAPIFSVRASSAVVTRSGVWLLGVWVRRRWIPVSEIVAVSFSDVTIAPLSVTSVVLVTKGDRSTAVSGRLIRETLHSDALTFRGALRRATRVARLLDVPVVSVPPECTHNDDGVPAG